MEKKIKELIPYVIIVIVVVTIRMFLVTPIIVSGDSMDPTLKDKQVLLLNKINYRLGDIKRFDIVVIKSDKIELGDREIIKRVIGLPGETVLYRSNKLYINDKEIPNDYNFKTDDFSLTTVCNCERIPEGKYLVLGDNRGISADSRLYGLFDESEIAGSVNFSLWPIKIIK